MCRRAMAATCAHAFHVFTLAAVVIGAKAVGCRVYVPSFYSAAAYYKYVWFCSAFHTVKRRENNQSTKTASMQT